MRRSIIVVLFALLATMLAVPAAAIPPDRGELPPAEPWVDDFSCDFQVYIEYPTDQYTEKVFFDQDGNITKVIQTGHVTAQLTNLDTGLTIVRNISGPTIFEFEDGEPTTFKAVGPWLILFFPGDLGEGVPGGLYFTYGQVAVDLQLGTIVKISGKVESICDPLS